MDVIDIKLNNKEEFDELVQIVKYPWLESAFEYEYREDKFPLYIAIHSDFKDYEHWCTQEQIDWGEYGGYTFSGELLSVKELKDK